MKKISFNKIKENKGFVILFAVVLSSIILTITVGVANIALKEVKFSTSAKESNLSFYAADTGAECALVNDKTPSLFPFEGPATNLGCAPGSTAVFTVLDANNVIYNFKVLGLGQSGLNCAIVTVQKTKDAGTGDVSTEIKSKGYNLGGNSTCPSTSSNPNFIEREIKVSY